jgi:hypothetical protein
MGFVCSLICYYYLSTLFIQGSKMVDQRQKIVKCCGRVSCNQPLAMKKKPQVMRANHEFQTVLIKDHVQSSLATNSSTAKTTIKLLTTAATSTATEASTEETGMIFKQQINLN